MSSPSEAPRSSPLTGLTRNVFVLGAVSLFTDISSEMIVPVRILFLVSVLHTPLVVAGVIEGAAESIASLLKIVSGRLADQRAERKPLIVFGYGVSNLAKPLLALATSWQMALGLILIDRTGKGVRGSPRDAIIADSTPTGYRGKAFGFHRSMDTLGAAIGPLLTFGILALTQNDLRAVFAWTLVPGVLSVLVLIVFLREQKRSVPAQPAAARTRFNWREAQSLGTRFWLFTFVSTLFALGNSSDAFIFLRTEGLEHSLEVVPLAYFGFNVVYALLATPLGALSDRFGRLPVLVAGYAAFGIVYAGWALANQAWQPWVLFLVYGIYAAATEGISRAMVTDTVDKTRHGTALGWFNGLTGLVALPANVIGGWLWTNLGPSATFALGAWLAIISAGLLIAWAPWLTSARPLTDRLQTTMQS